MATVFNQFPYKQQHFKALWLAETIRLQEEHNGSLEDSEAVRQAKRNNGNLTHRILTRAHWLAKRTKLLSAQDNWITGMIWSMRILCVLAGIAGVLLVFPTFSATERTINIFSALGSLLGLNLFMLLLWLVGTFGLGQSVNQLGKFWLWLTGKLSRQSQSVQLLPGLLSLLHQRRLEKWWLGQLSNCLWLITLSMAVVMLLLLLATQRYGFIWQTTILSGDYFVIIVRALGYLPSLMGFPIPSETLILQSGDTAVMTDIARQTWAAWLVGVLVIYGILPRLLLVLICHLFWRMGCNKLNLDLNLSGYSLLKQRLLPDAQIIGVTDAAPKQWVEPISATGLWVENGALLVAIELDTDYPWPPKLPNGVTSAGIIESRAQRKELLEQLTIQPVARLVIACDPRRSTDRGTLSLITELANCATEAKVWLLAAPDDKELDQNRLQDWHESLKSRQLGYGNERLLEWLGAGNE